LNNPNAEYYFDESEANKAIGFIEKFYCIPKFQDGKQPFVLQLWQKALISCLFGFKHWMYNLSATQFNKKRTHNEKSPVSWC